MSCHLDNTHHDPAPLCVAGARKAGIFLYIVLVGLCIGVNMGLVIDPSWEPYTQRVKDTKSRDLLISALDDFVNNNAFTMEEAMMFVMEAKGLQNPW